LQAPWFADVCGLCPLTAETEELIDADALGRMKASAYLLNAPARRQIRGAALDVMVEPAGGRAQEQRRLGHASAPE
jgi:hypothetical protein